MTDSVSTSGVKASVVYHQQFPESFERQPQNSIGSSSFTSQHWPQIGCALIDVLFVFMNSAAAFCIRFSASTFWKAAPQVFTTPPRGVPLSQYFVLSLLYATLVLLLCQSLDLYRTLRDRLLLDEALAVGKAILLATLLLTAFIYLSGLKEISRLWVGFSSFLNVATLTAWRLWKRRLVSQRVAKGIGTRNVLIIGAGKVGQALALHLEQNRQLGYAFKGFLDENQNSDARVLGKIENLGRVARANFVDEVLITIPSERDLAKSLAIEARRQRLDVKVVPELFGGLGWNAPVSYLGRFPLMELHREPIPALGLLVKRMIDIGSSLFALLFLSPLLASIALAVRLDSPGPVIYRSRRVGKRGRVFTCYKFRTMIDNADALKDKLRHLNERNGPFFKLSDDPRLTRLGKLRRKCSLDELPQLWNVLRSDMSLVGPRPHPLDDFEQYSLEHFRRLDVKPGVSGLWQVKARRDPSFETNMALDLEYIENWNIWLDLRILLATIPEVIRGNGR